MNRICVFCGSSSGSHPRYAEAARALGSVLVRRGISLVYGGGNVGLMGIIADEVMEAGGEVIGVIPDALVERELAHGDVTQMIVVRSMHERKAKMAELSNGFVAMPGGYGTFEEFCEVLTWTQLGLYRKPCGILNIEGYYDSFLALLDHAVAEEFIKPVHRRLVISDTHVESLVARLLEYEVPRVDKWISPQQT